MKIIIAFAIVASATASHATLEVVPTPVGVTEAMKTCPRTAGKPATKRAVAQYNATFGQKQSATVWAAMNKVLIACDAEAKVTHKV